MIQKEFVLIVQFLVLIKIISLKHSRNSIKTMKTISNHSKSLNKKNMYKIYLIVENGQKI